jgi:hypothetical protein
LYIGSERPIYSDAANEEHLCNICLCLKSHPVTYVFFFCLTYCALSLLTVMHRYTCGHGHCYVCIRMWLEHDWRCPECRAVISCPPFRVFSEEKSIKRTHGDWDASRVYYSWTGLAFSSTFLL